MNEENTEETYEEGDEIETVEDLSNGEEIPKKKEKRKLVGDVIDNNYPEIYLNDSQVPKETPYEYSTVTITIKPSQRNLICFVQQYLGFGKRTNFIRYILLDFCRTQMKLIQAKKEADLKFIEDFKKLRRKELMIKNKVKEKVEELKKMAPSQDDGEDPFTEEDLME